jgi:hypothetical protein
MNYNNPYNTPNNGGCGNSPYPGQNYGGYGT